MAFLSYLHFIAAITNVYLAIMIYRRDHKLTLNRASICVFLAFAVWSACLVVVHNPFVSRTTAILFENLGIFGWASFPIFVVWQTRAYAGRPIRQPITGLLFGGGAIFVAILTVEQFRGHIVAGHILTGFGWYGIWTKSVWSLAYLSYVLLFSSISLITLWHARWSAPNRLRRNQASLLFVSGLLSFVLGVMADIVARFAGVKTVPPVADLFFLIWVWGVMRAISRYHFLTITPASVADRIIENMADILVLCDSNGFIVSANKAAVGLLGVEPDRLVGRPLIMLFPQLTESGLDSGERITRTTSRIPDVALKTATGETVQVSLTVVHLANGETVCIGHDSTPEVKARMFLEKDRDLLEHVVLERTRELKQSNDDLSGALERYRSTAENLKESEERLRILFESAPDAYYMCDLSGTFLDGNVRAEELTGYRREELIGKNFFKLKLLPADQLPKAVRQLAVNVTGKGTGPDEFVLRRRDNSRVTVEISTYPVTISGKKVVLGIARDTSGRHKVQIALRQSEEKFRLAFENARDAILWVDAATGEITNCNRSATELLERSASDLLGRHFSVLHDQAHVADYSRILTPSFCDNQNVILNTELRAGSGSIVPVEISASMTDIGNHRLVQIVFHDISERARAEEVRTELEGQLRQAEKLKAIGELTGGIAHDFNNMLGAVAGYADMIKGRLGDNDPKLKKYVDGILSAAGRSAKLTEQLLTFSRKGNVQLAPVAIHQILDEVVQMVEHTFDRAIVVNHTFGAESAVVMADSTQIQNAVLNLAVNARDAMPKGGCLTITTETVVLGSDFKALRPYRVTPGRHIKITVSDNGSGMDEPTRKRIFEPFFTTKEKGKGTGLGLSSVYGTVKSHGGYIEVESVVGTGTAVTVWLPLLEENGGQDATAPLANSGDCHKTILVVDDEDMVRDITCELIVAKGCRAIAFAGAEEVLAFCSPRTKPGDMILLDMVMPGLNGEECFSRLRTSHPDVPIVLMSGFAHAEETERFSHLGARAFLQKPFNKETLYSTLEHVLKNTDDPVR